MFKLNLNRPLVIFDLETTGINIVTDRIVEIGMIKLMPDGSSSIMHKKINPTIPIPYEVSLIHGIFDKDVVNEPTFEQVGKQLYNWLDGCDLGGFNIVNFDLPLLVEEFLRINIDIDSKKRKIVDAQKIFHLMEKRNLISAYKFYCNQDLINAHSAMNDAQATLEVLLAQIEKYEGSTVKDLTGKEYGLFENNINYLHNLNQSNNRIDFAGRFVYKDGKEIINFGKYKNQPIIDTLKKDPNYFQWIMNNEFSLDTKNKLTKIKLNELNSNKK